MASCLEVKVEINELFTLTAVHKLVEIHIFLDFAIAHFSGVKYLWQR